MSEDASESKEISREEDFNEIQNGALHTKKSRSLKLFDDGRFHFEITCSTRSTEGASKPESQVVAPHKLDYDVVKVEEPAIELQP